MVIQSVNRTGLWLRRQSGWNPTVISAITSDTTIAVASEKFTSTSTGTFDEFFPGLLINVSGFSNSGNNGFFEVVAVNGTGDEITVSPKPSGGDETDGPSIDMNLSYIQVGYTGFSLIRDTQNVQSEKIRADRMLDEEAEVGISLTGPLNTEFIYPKESDESLNDIGQLIEGFMQDRFNNRFEFTGSGATDDLKFENTEITGPTDWASEIKVGQHIAARGSGNSANNGIFRVTAINGDVLTVSKPFDSSWSAFTTEDSATSTINGSMVRNGVTPPAFTIYEEWNDISQYRINSDLKVTGWNLEMSARERITTTFDLIGRNSTYSSGSSGLQQRSAESKPIISASANIGELQQGGSTVSTGIQSLSISQTNNAEERAQIGSKFTNDVRMGTINATITGEFYFEDVTFLDLVKNHTSTDLVIKIDESQNNETVIFTYPKVYVSGDRDLPGINQDALINLEFRSYRDESTSCQVQVDVLKTA
jgi:hypothetical protein